jgi:hypothetical protein
MRRWTQMTKNPGVSAFLYFSPAENSLFILERQDPNITVVPLHFKCVKCAMFCYRMVPFVKIAPFSLCHAYYNSVRRVPRAADCNFI